MKDKTVRDVVAEMLKEIALIAANLTREEALENIRVILGIEEEKTNEQ